MDTQTVYEYIKSEEASFRTARIPLTDSKDWNMLEHITRCTNVANAWFHKGKNDGLRPYDDIVTPIINVAFRSEGFDVKDIVPYVDSSDDYFKSFLIKKYHPQWARRNEIDTFIDDVVETSVIYDLVLVKNINHVRPEVVDLKTIAFCDQTDIMSGPICIKHQLTIAELVKMKGKWDEKEIDVCIKESMSQKSVSTATDQPAKTPGKYITLYELRGNLPERWINENAKPNSYVDQMHIVSYYPDQGEYNGGCMYKGEDKPLSDNFKALKIDRVRSKGRACGRSIVESLFEPQVWNNYDAIKIKALLDSALSIFQTESDKYGDTKLNELKNNSIIKHEPGKPITRIDGSLQNLTAFTNHQTKMENSARNLGAASDLALGNTPASGTPLGTTEIVHVEGQGVHVYRQGKIATFFADVLYRDWILQYLVDEMNGGKDFSEELTLEEVEALAESVVSNMLDKRIKEQILSGGKVPSEDEREEVKRVMKESFMSGKTKMYSNGRGFFKALQDELKDIPVAVMVNIKGKQKDMAKVADALTNIIREVIRNPQAFTNTPGIGKATNELLENSGLSPIDFRQITNPVQAPAVAAGEQQQLQVTQ